MRVISLVNLKGGVAKTVSTINLAAAMSKAGKKVLIIDTDSQGNIAASMGLQPNELERTLAKADSAYEALTEAVLRASCAAVRSFLSVEPGFSVSVNITADQLNDRHFVEKVIRLVQEEGVCGNLGLEITEEASVLHMEQYLENIQLLKQHQIPVAIDDFSMGQTSIQYLQTNAFGCVKIDGSLVRPVAENPRCREIIASITGLGEKLHFTIIAECVENEKIRRELIALGCTRFQGYLYGPAVPQEEFLKEFLKPNLING